MLHGWADARAHAPSGPLHCAVVKLPRCLGKLTAQELSWPAAADMSSTTRCKYAVSCSHLTCTAWHPLRKLEHVTGEPIRESCSYCYCSS